MEQGFSMECVAQFLLSSDGASGKKHYHWNCNCALHSQCSHSSSAVKVLDVQKSGKHNKKKVQGISARSTSAVDLTGVSALRSDKKLYSMGNLLELLDSSRSSEEIRRDAANKEPL